MKANKLELHKITALSLILGTLAVTPANSQPITPANDSTKTTVAPQGQQFNIEGGTRSGANLFHSFDKFNVNSDQTANFVTTSDISNILGRIKGGASYIDGLIQVLGGNSNLFLMNPAGVMFGPNARLNIPASFSVTTATGIGFDNNNFWFQAMGTNDYANLVGSPSGYRFNVSNPGYIVNEGDLGLKSGENLTLLGGIVVNTGELSSAGGNITIAAVEGGSLLRISQPGHLLSLEVDSSADISNPISLGKSLAGQVEGKEATSMRVDDNGNVVLIGSNTIISETSGTATISGNIDVSTTSVFLPGKVGIGTGGQANVLGDRVALIDANINADGINGGGTVLIGGDFQGLGMVPKSEHTVVNNDSFISADAIRNGDGGRVIIWSDGMTNFGGTISAKGGKFSGNGGFVEVSGKQRLRFDGTVDVSAAFGTQGTILLDPENVTVGEENSEGETETEGENSEVSETENTENSTTETVGENSEVSETENTENSTTEVADNLETETETETEGDNSEVSETEVADNLEVYETENTENLEGEIIGENSEVFETKNTDNSTTKIADNSETETKNIGENSEVSSTKNTDDSTTKIAENSEVLSTEIADNSETTETETPIDPFAADENFNVTISADNLGELSGNVILDADNDITINERIETDSSVELRAGRSININADIDTSSGDGNIDLLGNNDQMNLANRSDGKGSINQLDGTILNAGSGRINIELGSLGEVGDIKLGNLRTTGKVLVDANGGNIVRVSESSLINAGSVLFRTSGNGGIGFLGEPLRLDVQNLEAVSGSGGVFFDVGNVNIGGVSEDVDGIATFGGDVDIKSAGNVTLNETISSNEVVGNNSEVASMEDTEVVDGGGGINIEATGDIVATGSGIKGGGEGVSLSGTNIRINDEFDETSGDANVRLSAINDITVENIEDDVLEFKSGSGEIEFRADVDGDGVGIVRMLDNKADDRSYPDVFDNGTDTIKTNGRGLTIAGAGLVLGNIDTSSYSSSGNSGNGGAIDLDAAGDITTQSLKSYSSFTSWDSENGGAISISTISGDINTQSLDSSSYSPYSSDSRSGKSENGGTISISTISGNIETQSLDSSSYSGSGNSGNGGAIDLDAGGNITTQDLNSFSYSRSGNSGNGGDITLNANTIKFNPPQYGNAEKLRINTFSVGKKDSGEGKGGDVNITTNNLSNTDIVTLSSHFKSGKITIENQTQEQLQINDSSIITSVKLEIKIPGLSDVTTIEVGEKGESGQISITSSSELNLKDVSIESDTKTNQAAGGDVNIYSIGDITLDKTEIISTTSSEGNAGKITIESGQNIELTNNTRIKASTEDIGHAGQINIKANNLTLDQNTSLITETASAGNPGEITIQAKTVDIGEGAQASATITKDSTNTEGGGNIEIEANTLDISGILGIFAQTQGEAPAGTLTLRTYNDSPDLDINFSNQGLISASRTSIGSGGNIEISAPLSIDIKGDGKISVETIGAGDAGTLKIDTSILSLKEGVSISAETNSGGKAGNIEINSPLISIGQDTQISATAKRGATNKEAGGGNISIFSNQLDISGKPGIFAQTQGEAPAGTLTLRTYKDSPDLDINFSNQGLISASSTSIGSGGNIEISAPLSIDIKGDGKISVETIGAGDAGTLKIDTSILSLKEGVSISAETNSGGKAGNIEINSPLISIGQDTQISATAKRGATNKEAGGGNISIFSNQLDISGKSGIFAQAQGEAPAGTLTLRTYNDSPDLDINFSNQGLISASSTSIGSGGNIDISAPLSIDIKGDGKISVETSGAGDAETIKIETQNLKTSDKISITASTTGKGNAGAINIYTNTFNLTTGTSLTTETNSAGKAGDISINSETLKIGEDAQLSATAKAGATNTEAGGNITINTNQLNITGQLGIFAETESIADAGGLILSPYKTNSDLDIIFSAQGLISASTSSTGNGGSIFIKAPENIKITGEGIIKVETEGSGNAGIISIATENLTIAENTKISASTSDSGNGGQININPSQTFQLEGEILTETTGTGDGGSIKIKTGEMTAPNSTISAKSTEMATGNAGTIDITAQGNITTGTITSAANNENKIANGDDISITSEQGKINATQPIQSFSEGGNAGDITLQGKTDITTNTISSHGKQEGGQINITSETGNIDTSSGEFLANYSGGGDAGDVTIEAPQGNITTTNIYSYADGDGGQISIKAGNNINIKENSNIISASEPQSNNNTDIAGKGGDITLEAGSNINTRNANIYSGADQGDTGKIDIIADNAIETGEIDLASGFERERKTVNENFTLIPRRKGEASKGEAGDITIRSQNSTIDTTGGTINSRSPDGTGDIIINAKGNITTGELQASALNESKPTTGGDINIISEQGEINATQNIETYSKQGTAGDVNITAAGHIHTNAISSYGVEQGGDINIRSDSENSIDAAGVLNTYSEAGRAGNVSLTSPGSINISGIRSEGMEQGGDIQVNSERGEINSTGNIDSYSEAGRGGNVEVNAPERVTLSDVSSFGMEKSGDLRIQSRAAQVNTGNVKTQASGGSSGSIFINGTGVGTGNLRSIGTTDAGEINVEATDGSIKTYDLEMTSGGTIGGLTLKSSGSTTTENIRQTAGEGDTDINIDALENITTGDIEQNADNNTNIDQIAGENINTGDIEQNAGNNTNIDQIAGENINTGDIEQNAGNNTNIDQIAGENINTGDIEQNAGNNTNIDQIAGENINTGNIEQNAGNNTSINQIAEGEINTPVINQNFGNETTLNQISEGDVNTQIINQNTGNESINIQNNVVNQNTDSNSGNSNNNSTLIGIINSSNNNQTTNTNTAKEQTESSINSTTETEEILDTIDSINTNPLTLATGSDQVITMLEENRTNEYSNYFGTDFNEEFINKKSPREILSDMAAQTGKESAVVYINAYPEELQIILYTKDGQPIIKTIPEADHKELMAVVSNFRAEITKPTARNTNSYLPPAQKLYNWFIAPISAELEAANIDTLLFSMSEGLRTVPVAVLHDGEQFLIEKYSLSLIPSVSLMDTKYRSLQDTQVLAMGASKFIHQSSLPAVPVELETISQDLWQGNKFLNEEFTLNNLLAQRQNYPYPIIHLATHAEFRPGKPSNSYIQLWGDEQIKLDQVRELGWNEPAVELLVLSACRTAVEDRNAELGYAGLAVAAGVKSALASLWYVSDEGTLGLMTEFYGHLNNANIKAEALRQAQLAMLREDVVIADGELRGSGTLGAVKLPSGLANVGEKKFSHPYYWAGFTIVGSPW